MGEDNTHHRSGKSEMEESEVVPTTSQGVSTKQNIAEIEGLMN